MKNKTIYFAIIFVLFVVLGIFGLQKDNIAKADSFTFKNLSFDVSLNPISLRPGGEIKATMTIKTEPYSTGCYEPGGFKLGNNWVGKAEVEIAGKEYTLFEEQTLCSADPNTNTISATVETKPGNYSATFSVYKQTCLIFFCWWSNPKEYVIPYTVTVKDSFRIDPHGSINMKVGDKIQLKAWYDDNIDDSIPEINVTNL